MHVKRLSIPPPILMLLSGVVMWDLAHHFPMWRIVPASWDEFGWWVMDASAVPPGIALVQFWRAGTTVNPLKPGSVKQLVTGGIYAWTRNPMYLGLAMLLSGWAISLGTLSLFIGPIGFVAVIQKLQIQREERALSMLFGERYEAYRRSVGRWFGRRLRDG